MNWFSMNWTARYTITHSSACSGEASSVRNAPMAHEANAPTYGTKANSAVRKPMSPA